MQNDKNSWWSLTQEYQPKAEKNKKQVIISIYLPQAGDSVFPPGTNILFLS